MARHRGDDQELRLGGGLADDRSIKGDHAAERTLPDGALRNGGGLSGHDRHVEPEGRLNVAAGGALEQLASCRDRAAVGRAAEWVDRVLEQEPGGVRRGAYR